MDGVAVKDPEKDEYGVPIRKATPAPSVDEYGVPIKKKVSTAASASTSPTSSTGSKPSPVIKTEPPKGSWTNLPSFGLGEVAGGLEKDLGNLFGFAKDKLNKMGVAGVLPAQGAGAMEDWLREGQHKDETRSAQNPLPNTTTGKIASTATKFVPDIIELATTPELDVAKLGKLGEYASKLGKYGTKAVNMAVGKFPLQQATKTMLQDYSDAKDKGENPDLAALEGFGKGYKNGLVFEGLGTGAGKLTEFGGKALEKVGFMSANKFVAGAEKRLLHATAQGIAFSAAPVLQNAVEGKGTDLDQMKDNALFGAVLGGLTGHTPEGETTGADKAAAQILMRKPLVDLHNFVNADIDDITHIHNYEKGYTAADMQAESASHAEDGFKATDPEEKANHVLQSSLWGNAASIKSFTEAISKDKQGVINEVNQMDLPDEAKKAAVDKINEVYKAIDPVEQVKTGLAKQIEDLQGEPDTGDIVKDKEKKIKLQDLNSQLDGIIKQQFEDEKTKTTENNQIINPTENEKGSENAEKGQKDESGQNAEKGNEKNQKDENVNASGVPDNAPGVTEKPRYSIKGETITKLPTVEHVELNNLLKEDGINISHLKDVNNQERDESGKQPSETPTNAEAVQQPENDGAGNAGKDRPGETAEGSKSSKGKATFKKPPVTAIANADVAAERGEEIDRTHKTKADIEAEGKRLVESGDLEPESFAKALMNKPRPITAEEQSALRYHKAKLNNRQRELTKEIGTNPDTHAENEIEYARNEDLLEQNRKATEIAGNETGRALGDRQDALAEDYSRVNILRKAKIANGGELDPRDEKELTERTKRITDLESKLADREEEIRKLQEKNTVSKVKREAETEERNAKREITKASLRKEREGLVADLHLIAKKARSSAGANKIPVDMLVPLTKLARNYVLDGAITVAQVADKIYNDIKDHIEGVTKDEISDVIKNGFNDYLREQNEVRLGQAKKLQKTKLEKLKDENYEQKVFKKIQVDNDYLNIRAEINREQQRVNKKIQDIENSKKSLNRKIVDVAVKYGRQAKLASVTVLGKLASTGLATIGIKPVTEGIGKGVSAILPRVAKRASVEGSVSRSAMREAAKQTEGAAVKSISQAYARAFTTGMKDAWQELSQGGSNLTALYKERGATLPAEAKEFFGHLHSAIKAPIKRFAWELSYSKRAAKTIEAGLDPLNPVNDAQNRLGAYKDAEKAIFMGDNELSKRYEDVVGKMEKSNSSAVRTTAAAFRILLPFVKVPTNIVLEGAKYSFGSASGIARLGRALAKGMDNLTPEEADTILEHLKKGSIGGAALLIGFYNPKNFGGFYKPGNKHKLGAGHIKVGDVNIPAFMIEHPIFIAAQVGANFRQLLDKYRHKDDRISTATLATMSGLGYEVPQANEIKRLVDMTGNITSMKKWEKFGAETLKGEIEPVALQQLATITDVKPGAKTAIPGVGFTEKTQQQRKPNQRKGFMKYVGQTLETGVPGLRENVPKK